MLGLESIHVHSDPGSRQDPIDDSHWTFENVERCELCQSRSYSLKEYGMRVCRPCNRELLP